MACDAYRTYARTASSVRAGEGLVQVQVAHVGSDGARIGQPHLCVHVGSVHVDLRAAPMDDLADFLDVVLEDAVGRGVGNHQGGKAVAVGFGFRAQVGYVYVAMLVASAGQGFISGLHRRRGIGAVCRSRNQDQVAVSRVPKPESGSGCGVPARCSLSSSG